MGKKQAKASYFFLNLLGLLMKNLKLNIKYRVESLQILVKEPKYEKKN